MRTAAIALALAACSASDPEIVATTALGSTHDINGPYHVDSAITGVIRGDDVELMVAIDSDAEGRFAPRAMRGAGELYGAAIGGQPAGTDVFYFVRVVRDGEVVARDPDSHITRSFGFQVLSPDGACRVDSECVAGVETCVDELCAPLPDACEGDGDCPAGYGCEVDTGTCALQPRGCDTDADCPTSDECDAATAACAPRHLCSAASSCPDGYTCNVPLGRCY